MRRTQGPPLTPSGPILPPSRGKWSRSAVGGPWPSVQCRGEEEQADEAGARLIRAPRGRSTPTTTCPDKSDWLARGLPAEGELAARPTARGLRPRASSPRSSMAGARCTAGRTSPLTASRSSPARPGRCSAGFAAPPSRVTHTPPPRQSRSEDDRASGHTSGGARRTRSPAPTARRAGARPRRSAGGDTAGAGAARAARLARPAVERAGRHYPLHRHLAAGRGGDRLRRLRGDRHLDRGGRAPVRRPLSLRRRRRRRATAALPPATAPCARWRLRSPPWSAPGFSCWPRSSSGSASPGPLATGGRCCS
jgi:hypothetical protein